MAHWAHFFILSWIAKVSVAAAGDSVVTSIQQMQVLYRSEKSFVTQISDFADRLQQLVDSMRIYSNSFEDIRPRKVGSEAMQNPIDAHLLIRHLATGWPALKKSLEKFHDLMEIAEYLKTREEREKLPDEKDMTFTEMALVRLVVTYKLNATQFVRGILDTESFVNEFKSDRAPTVWDLGRIAIGLLNYQAFSPAIEILDEAVKVLQKENEGGTKASKSEGITFSKSSSAVVPANINEEMRSEDLLELQYKAIKEHDGILEKVIKKEIQTFGDGLRILPYRKSCLTKEHTITAVQEAFRNTFQLQLNTIPDPIMEREQTFRLCRGQELRNVITLSKLHCRLSRATFPPAKLEEISLVPSIVLAHEIMGPNRMRQIIRTASTKLQGSAPDASMSFKSALLDVDVTFMRRLESITGTKAVHAHQMKLPAVRNFGVVGSFGIHSDLDLIQQENDTHGVRLRTAQVFLTHVGGGGYVVFPRIGVHVRPQPGSALIYSNVDQSGHQDPLLVSSDCPVAHGNKWVLLYWLNAQQRQCPIRENF